MNSEIKQCRACGNKDLIPVIDIGDQYFSSIFPDSTDYSKYKKYPLNLVLCNKTKNTCGLLQLGFDLDLSDMYKSYPYLSSANPAMISALRNIVSDAMDLNILDQYDTILDIGCNDGTLLSFFDHNLYQLVGIDPANNFFVPKHIKFANELFSKKTFFNIAYKKAKLIFSIAMFYHLTNPISFCKEVEQCLDDDGVWIIQMAYLPSMIDNNMYDNIVHEHNAYYCVETLQWVLDKANLEIFDVSFNNVYGGSYRIFVKKKSCSRYARRSYIEDIKKDERSKNNIYDKNCYLNFDRRIRNTRSQLLQLLSRLKAEHKEVWIYGASTKGNTILQYCGIDNKYIKAAADSNSYKHGKYIIGTNIQIVSEEELRERKPHYLLVLPYGFVDAFVQRENGLFMQGTKFIVPLPNVDVISRWT